MSTQRGGRTLTCERRFCSFSFSGRRPGRCGEPVGPAHPHDGPADRDVHARSACWQRLAGGLPRGPTLGPRTLRNCSKGERGVVYRAVPWAAAGRDRVVQKSPRERV